MWTYSREVVGSKLVWSTAYQVWGSPCYSSGLHTGAGYSPQTLRLLSSHCLTVHPSPDLCRPLFCLVGTDTDHKEWSAAAA
jgi:hypothetical protein